MKIFVISFVLIFIILITGFYSINHYINSEIERENQEIASYTRQVHKPSNDGAADDFSLPGEVAEPASAPVREPARPDASHELANQPATEKPRGTESGFVHPAPIAAHDAEAEKQLLEMGYSFDEAAFFAAIARDDNAAVELFLRAKMPLDSPLNFLYKLEEDSLFRFYASQSTMLYNPLSLAIVAGAGRSLPLLLAAAAAQGKLMQLNEMTCLDRRKIDKAGFDLLGLALQTGDVSLLRSLIAAGLKPLRQTYLMVAMNSHAKFSHAEISPESRREIFSKKADLMVELINAGQNVRQRIPLPIPVPPVMEMFFAMAGKEIRNDLIARVASETVRQELQAIADHLDKAMRRKN